MLDGLNIKLTYDQVDNIIVQTLKEDYLRNIKHTKIDHSDDIIDPDYELIIAIDKVLDYYMSPDDKIAWAKEKRERVNGG